MTYTHPEIKTSLPGPKALEIINRDKSYLSTSCSREYPLAVDHGDGVWLWDVDGNRYLDFMAGIAVASTGHSHPEIVKAITDQAAKFIHVCSMDFYFDVLAKYAERLTTKTQIKGNGKNRVFFANSGVEVWEGAVKLARYKTGRPNVICFYGAFHGRTLAAITANASKTRQKRGFGPLAPGFFHGFYPNPKPIDKDVPYTTEACINFLKNYLFGKMVSPDEVAAISVEPIQGEGGYIVPPKEFMQELRKLCDEHGILLIADEIQSGIGRTGKFFAMEHFDVKPDIVCMAKGIASGLPLSAFVANENVMDWPVGVHGSTFGGNPVALAAAAKTLDLIESSLMDNAGKVGDLMLGRLREMAVKYPLIGDVRGIGLMIGVEIVDTDHNYDGKRRDDIIRKCYEHGLLLLACGASAIRFCPPLVLTEAQAEMGLDIFEDVLKTL